jgi:hypothetical protein
VGIRNGCGCFGQGATMGNFCRSTCCGSALTCSGTLLQAQSHTHAERLEITAPSCLRSAMPAAAMFLTDRSCQNGGSISCENAAAHMRECAVVPIQVYLIQAKKCLMLYAIPTGFAEHTFWSVVDVLGAGIRCVHQTQNGGFRMPTPCL